ncbi:MAG: aminotransferase class IV [Planctomycetes bacterium]|nr:aminotransferase class IV [Planctomycetota bacterium]
MEYLSLNGKILPEAEAQIPATDPAVAHGLGLFEVTRAYRGVPFRIADHLSRMRRSATRFGLRLAPGRVGEEIAELCRRNRLEDAYVRITLTGGGNFLIRTRPLERLPAAWYRRGARVLLAESRRDPAGILYGHKTLNYLENVMLRDRARRAGAADTILIGLGGEVLEGCVSNVFLVRRGRLVTPSLDAHILPGVTRKVVLGLAARARLRVDERTVGADEMTEAEEAFLTNSLVEVLPVTRIGAGRVAGPGRITRFIADEYRKTVERETGR